MIEKEYEEQTTCVKLRDQCLTKQQLAFNLSLKPRA